MLVKLSSLVFILFYLVVTIFLGVYLSQVRLGNKGVYVMIAYCVGVGVVVVFEICLLLSKGKTSRPPSITGRAGGKSAPVSMEFFH